MSGEKTALESGLSEVKKLRAERDHLRDQVQDLTEKLARANERADSEEDLRLKLEERITKDIAETNRAIGYAALRLLALESLVNEQ